MIFTNRLRGGSAGLNCSSVLSVEGAAVAVEDTSASGRAGKGLRGFFVGEAESIPSGQEIYFLRVPMGEIRVKAGILGSSSVSSDADTFPVRVGEILHLSVQRL